MTIQSTVISFTYSYYRQLCQQQNATLSHYSLFQHCQNKCVFPSDWEMGGCRQASRAPRALPCQLTALLSSACPRLYSFTYWCRRSNCSFSLLKLLLFLAGHPSWNCHPSKNAASSKLSSTTVAGRLQFWVCIWKGFRCIQIHTPDNCGCSGSASSLSRRVVSTFVTSICTDSMKTFCYIRSGRKQASLKKLPRTYKKQNTGDILLKQWRL